MTIEYLLPPPHHAKEVMACLGLISDTHYPLRCETVPANLFKLFAGVDLILHAGDVGELGVLDQLATIAPVIAVHGNDETEQAQQTLPYQQIIHIQGKRILLWHSHFPDRQEELASRVDDAMVPKFQRTIDRARAASATIAVFGHWHIPLIYRQDGVTVINPGALASGNFYTRQLVQSVALLHLFADGSNHVTHVDLATPMRALIPQQEWPASFQQTLARYGESILSPALEAWFTEIRPQLSDQARRVLIPIILPLAQRCWRGEQERITLEELIQHVEADATLTATVRHELNLAL